MLNYKLPFTTELDALRPNRINWSLYGSAVLAILMGGVIAVGVYHTAIWTVLAVFGLIFLVLAVARPDISVIAFAFVLYLNLSDVLINQGYPSIAKPFVGLLAGILLIRWLVLRDKFKGLAKPLFYVALYTIMGSISLFFADDFTAAFSTLSVYLKDAVICFLIVLLIQDKETLIRVIRVILIAGIIMGSIAVFQQITRTFSNNYFGFAGAVADSTYGLRIAGPVGDPNFFAQVMVVLLPLAAERIMNEKRLVFRLLAIWAFLVCLLTVVITYSRGAFLAALVAFILMAYRRRPSPSQVVTVVLAVIVIYQFLPSNYTERISTLFDFLPGSSTSTYADLSFRGRSSENMVAINMFKDNPIIGVGMGNYNNKYQEYSRQLGIDFRIEARSAHSLYLEILAERGLLGILSFIIMIYYTFVSLHNAQKFFSKHNMLELSDLTSAIIIAFATYLVTATFLHDALIRYFWLLMGVAWSVPQAMVLMNQYPLNKSPRYYKK